MTAEADAPIPPAPAIRIARMATTAARLLLGVMLLIMVALNVINAICRYVFGIVFPGADEILVFMMVWLVMLGLILVTAQRSNIALDFLVLRSSPRSRRLLEIFHHVVMTVCCALATFYCWTFVSRVAAIGQTSMALGLPMAVPHFALVVGFAGTTIVAAFLVVADVAALRDESPAKAMDRA